MVSKKKTSAASKVTAATSRVSKTQVSRARSSKSQVAKRSKSASPPKTKIENQKAFWREDLQRLMSQQYPDLDAAIYALIDSVINRLGAGAKYGKSEREFLYMTFQTDPEIRALLSKTLSIKQKG
jgi:hypothetical protein